MNSIGPYIADIVHIYIYLWSGQTTLFPFCITKVKQLSDRLLLLFILLLSVLQDSSAKTHYLMHHSPVL